MLADGKQPGAAPVRIGQQPPVAAVEVVTADEQGDKRTFGDAYLLCGHADGHAVAFIYEVVIVAGLPAQVVNYAVIQIKFLTLRGDYFVLRLQPFILPLERISECVEVVRVLGYLLHKRVGYIDAVGAQGRQHLVEHPALEALG